MAETQEYGFDKDRFPKLSDESYDCIICSEVVRNPRECTGCGSLFCAPCINSWLTKTKECPNRCNPNTDSIKPIGKALLKMYNDLDIKCQYYEQCKQIVKLIDLEQHEKTCQLPKCGNFELCGNFLKKDEKVEACSPECLLILKLKSANGDWKLVHNELKEFLTPYIGAKAPVKQLSHTKSNSEITNPGNESSVVGFKWDSRCCGANIKLTEDDTRAYLEEASYIFKTVLGSQGFTGGVNYWEIHADPKTENELKIGVSTKRDFDLKSAFCDFEYGYAYYGLGQLRHNSNANGTAYGKKFKKEGVLGICLDMTKGTLSFALNGEYFGVAYSSEALKKGPIYPAVALLHNAGCKLVSGKPVPAYFPK